MAHIRNDLTTGRRLYIQTAYGEAVVERLKDLGAHYDRDRADGQKGLWWLSPTKRAAVEELLVAADQRKDADAAAGKPEAKEDLSGCRVYAQVSYKGRRYYVIAETKDVTRCRLTTLDGETAFWADCAQCELIKRYEGREKWDGRRYSGKTITVYPTIGSLREFRDSQKRAEKDGLPACAACGKRSADLVADLEDGMLKHPHCCDIAP